MHLAEILLGDSAPDLLEGRSVHAGEEDRISSAAMRLTALHANALESREHMVAVEKSDLLSVLEILKAISGKRRAHDILYVFVDQIARIIDTDRCSIVRIWNNDDKGHVEASHEDAQISDRIIELKKYPELVEAIRIGEKIVINDVVTDPLTMEFSQAFQRAGITSLIVMPITINNEHVGTLLLRAARRGAPFSLREISFFEIVAEAAANALERAQMFDTIQQAHDRLARLAITDSLTGLYNRRYFHDHFKQEFDRMLRYKHPLSCIIADVDNFKMINDTYGHLTGDSVLQQIAKRITAGTRSVDIAARYGGEEFAILLPNTGKEGAKVEAERLCNVIADEPFDDMPEGTQVTISVGLATCDPETMNTPEDLLRAADNALYDAKRAGKNRVVVHKPEKKD
jgi:diguanylate cyclase (GGDEF)-like protein